MKSPIRSDVSIDTVTLYWQRNFQGDFDLSDWTVNEQYGNEHAALTYKDGPVTLTFIPDFYILLASFSASKVANAVNTIAYKCEQYPFVRDIVEKTIKTATGQRLCIADSLLSRLDVYKTFVFKTHAEAEKMVRWMQQQPRQGRIKKRTYANNGDYRWYKNSYTCKSYIKNDDPHISEKARESIKPSVRLEIEFKKNARRKHIGNDVSGEYALKYPSLWASAYNEVLSEQKLDGKVLNKSEFKRQVRDILKIEYPTARNKTIDKYLNLLLSLANERNRKRTELINKIAKHGICPFYTNQKYKLKSRETLSVEQQMTIELFNQCIIHNREKRVQKCSIPKFTKLKQPINAGNLQEPAILDSS